MCMKAPSLLKCRVPALMVRYRHGQSYSSVGIRSFDDVFANQVRFFLRMVMGCGSLMVSLRESPWVRVMVPHLTVV